MRTRRPSLLHVQMGQETIYLIMTIAVVCALALWRTSRGDSDRDPIIMLDEAGGYRFALGSAALTPEFEQKLVGGIVPKLIDLGQKYRATVIEVVGHTDETPVRRPVSTLDESLMSFLSGSANEPPTFTDNVGLGMSRAAAVIRVLQRDGRLDDFEILPLSAGQTTGAEGRLARGTGPADDPARRRIEVRLRR